MRGTDICSSAAVARNTKKAERHCLQSHCQLPLVLPHFIHCCLLLPAAATTTSVGVVAAVWAGEVAVRVVWPVVVVGLGGWACVGLAAYYAVLVAMIVICTMPPPVPNR